MAVRTIRSAYLPSGSIRSLPSAHQKICSTSAKSLHIRSIELRSADVAIDSAKMSAMGPSPDLTPKASGCDCQLSLCKPPRRSTHDDSYNVASSMRNKSRKRKVFCAESFGEMNHLKPLRLRFRREFFIPNSICAFIAFFARRTRYSRGVIEPLPERALTLSQITRRACQCDADR